MKAFTTLVGTVVSMPFPNIDTDQLLPKQFLKTVEREGLGKALFFDSRYDARGAAIEDYVLNQPRGAAASILIAGENFGCGSSREHAVWALADFGFRCVIAPSFADIFSANCAGNGLLLISLPPEDIEILSAQAASHAGRSFAIDLPAQTISAPSGLRIVFDIDPSLKTKLIEGLDAIAVTLRLVDEIRAFEERLPNLPGRMAELIGPR